MIFDLCPYGLKIAAGVTFVTERAYKSNPYLRRLFLSGHIYKSTYLLTYLHTHTHTHTHSADLTDKQTDER